MNEKQYEEVSERILELVGGAENVKRVSHCITRLRIDPVDLSKCDTEALKKVEGSKGCVVNNGQVQVIIGKEVEDLFPVFEAKAGKAGASSADDSSDGNENILNRLLNGVASIFIPVFPALASAGLLNGILAILRTFGLIDTATGTYTLLSMFANATFYFLPVFVAYSSAKVFKCKPVVAMLLATIMLHPTYTAMTDSTEFLGLTVPIVDYSSSVFPIIAGVFILSLVERVCKKFIPKSVSNLFTPLICVLIVAPVMLIVVGPVIDALSDAVGAAVVAVYNATGVIGGAIFGAVYPFMVFTGLHHAVVPVELQCLADLGYDPFLGLCAVANAAVGGAAIMASIDSKNPNFKALSLSSGVTALIGTTEPALYGVLGVLKRPFVGAAAGGAVGGAIIAFFGVTATGLGSVPLAGFGMFLGDKFGWYVVSVIAAVAVSMLVTHFVGFEDVKIEEE